MGEDRTHDRRVQDIESGEPRDDEVLADVNTAAHDTESGATVKPILLM
ncbi:MAG: hypothetical protein ACT4QG_16590 [Sporichthyaceae bacterium]